MTQFPLTLVNAKSGQSITLNDRGLAYGDGVFETMLVTEGDICLWQLHYERLSASLQRLGIVLESSRLLAHIKASMAAIGQYQGVLKLTVTRGVGTRGYGPTGDEQATLISQFSPLAQDFYTHNHRLQTQGASVHRCQTRLPIATSIAGMKTLNQLPYVLASQERQAKPYDEGIVFNEAEYLIEASARNIFLVKDNALFTPSLNEGGVAGVMRRLIMENLAVDLGIAVHEMALVEKNFLLADEVLLSNSVSHIWPVKRYEGHSWSIGEGITQKLQEASSEFIRQDKRYSLSRFMESKAAVLCQD